MHLSGPFPAQQFLLNQRPRKLPLMEVASSLPVIKSATIEPGSVAVLHARSESSPNGTDITVYENISLSLSLPCVCTAIGPLSKVTPCSANDGNQLCGTT